MQAQIYGGTLIEGRIAAIQLTSLFVSRWLTGVLFARLPLPVA
jgi:hypothetical protein